MLYVDMTNTLVVCVCVCVCRAEAGLCTNVSIGDTVSVNVRVNMTECLEGSTTAYVTCEHTPHPL